LHWVQIPGPAVVQAKQFEGHPEHEYRAGVVFTKYPFVIGQRQSEAFGRKFKSHPVQIGALLQEEQP
jgi:hypothetical protein